MLHCSNKSGLLALWGSPGPFWAFKKRRGAMRLSTTISQLSLLNNHIGAAGAMRPIHDRLSDFGLGENPGDLRARYYVPPRLKNRAPLVVVLHGCTQSAAAYDQGSGWSKLADRCGFALLFPEQQRTNNPNLCFNWYQSEDNRRGAGEAASIRAMVEHMVANYELDPAQISITGLSAGGAMTSAMLAAYPDVFAAGAIIAGLPSGCADTLPEALSSMAAPGHASGKTLGDAVRAASDHRGPWPRISVWHGSADRLVLPGNGAAIVRQWCDVHGLAKQPTRIDTVDGHPRRVWAAADGEAVVEEYIVSGMGHGTPLRPGSGEGESGIAGAHMLDVGLSSTDRIAAFFGIAPEPIARSSDAPVASLGPIVAPDLVMRATGTTPTKRRTPESPRGKGVRAIIEDALRSAGLMP
jgi:poly(hydroxyalkanoate) depolymerase family esterase